MKLTSLLAVLCLFTLSAPSYALGDRTDYDLDDNGLIEINDLADLNEIRNNLNGKTLYGSSAGCPETGCIGFELTADLDFDTNADGKMDAQDAYWNSGAGWVPIGTTSNALAFAAVFEGNGHVIRNLFINRSGSTYQGLFGRVNSASIRNVGLTGPLLQVTGYDYTGGLIGYASASDIVGTYATGRVLSAGSSAYYLGGLVGYLSNSTLEASFTSGQVTASSTSSQSVGGLVGYVNDGSHLRSVFSSADVIGAHYVGGLVGRVYDSASAITNGLASGRVTTIKAGTSYVGGVVGNESGKLTATYWATDSTQQTVGGGASGSDVTGATLAQLRCAIAADDTGCLPGTTLFAGWGSVKNAQGESLWDFGDNTQLPGLRLNGVVYRDSDGDGIFDPDDKFPSNRAAAFDYDNDGYPDRWTIGCDQACRDASGFVIDQFPHNSAAHLDTDFDGLPDAWNASCDLACQAASGLTLDLYLNDSDNDGIVNALDEDTVDKDGDGLIEIATLEALNAIRFNLAGTSFKTSATDVGNAVGCPPVSVNGVMTARCTGYELTADLDFDTNADGKIDAQDAYWNRGAGWVPIGSTSDALAFAAVFEGNGHVIRNLFINRNSTQYQGLFGRVHNGSIRNIGLTGSLMQVVGGKYSGALAGVASSSEIIGSYSTGHVMNTTGADFIGGLLGILKKSTLESSFSTGLVAASGSDYIGGLVGQAWDNSQLRSVFSTAAVTGSSNVGGLVGDIDGTTSSLTNGFAAGRVTAITAGVDTVNAVAGSQRSKISATYFATDGTQQSAGGGTGSTGATLAQLRCAIAADDTGCLPGTTLFAGWGSVKNAQGESLWDFGDNTQLLGLRLNGVVYRDSDGDGVLDQDDKFPSNRAAAFDYDNDGYPDRWTIGCDQACRDASGFVIDQFPHNSAAHLDTDFDGLPDAWNASCDLACQAASGLTLDLYLNDNDNDGIVNALDEDTVDKDGDGLIEIATLEALNAIRFNLAGTSFKTSATDVGNAVGCPPVSVNGVMTARCTGYELTADLDFDTNADGKIDAQDAYWNSGAGWVPIGSTSDALSFAAVFEGNGHVIRNLFINRNSTQYQGLFGWVHNGSIRNIGLTGSLMQVVGGKYSGALAGVASSSEIIGSYSTGHVMNTTGADFIGGLLGILKKSTLESSFSTGLVAAASGSDYIGGLVGQAWDNSQLRSVFSTAAVTGSSNVGGLVGDIDGTTSSLTNGFAAGRVTAITAGVDTVNAVAGSQRSKISATYFATDGTQQSAGGGTGSTGATLAQLRCAIAADDTGCLPGTTLFAGWGSVKNAQGESLWDFGDNTQLPTLRLNGGVYRDSDGDGILDPDDAFPFNPAASADSDGDGAPDSWNVNCDSDCRTKSGLVLDTLPLSAAASIDTDGDGAPDTWNENCDVDCRVNSGLVLDAFPTNAAASLDSDGDGAPDAWNENCDADCQANSGLVLDAFPASAAASLDSDGDGAPDTWNENCDADCRVNSGLVLDAFPTNAAASLDSDGDGAPDSWNIDCETECQLKSGLQIDAHPFDQDNDGVVDSIDPDNTKDNGAPILQTIPDDLVLHATGVSTSVELNTASLLAWDVIDSLSELRFEVSLNGNVLTIDEHSQVSLPSGRHSLHWTAIDSSGNRSESLAQSVVIYPSVGFSQVELVAGEGSVVRVPLVFSGPSPDYPVVVNFQWDELLGEVSLEDFDESMDVEKLQVTISDEDDLAEAALSIVFKDDNLDEANEKLVLSLVSAKVGDDASVELTLDEEASTKTIVVTDTNLAPKVSLKFEHQGEEQVFTSAAVNEIELDLYSGEFQLVAIVEDPNGRDTHRYSWNLGALPYELGESDAHLNLDPIELLEGEYEISLQVTDSGIPNLTSDVVNLKLRIVDKSRSSSSLSSFSSSSSDGSSSDSTSSSNVSSTDSSDVSSSSSSAVSSSASSSQPIVKKKKSGGSSSSGLLLLLALLGTPMVLRKRRRV